MNNLEQERARFEYWVSVTQSVGIDLSIRDGADRYHCASTQLAFEAWQARCPEGYKCVPVEPTEAMVDAASEAYMPFGDMALAIQAAIVYAPQLGEEN